MTRDLRFGLFWRITVVVTFGVRLIWGQAPSDEEQRYLRSVLPLIQERNWSDAENKFKEGLSQFPRSALLANALGMVYEQQGKEDAAVRQFEQALEWLPSLPQRVSTSQRFMEGEESCAKASELYTAAGEADGRCGRPDCHRNRAWRMPGLMRMPRAFSKKLTALIQRRPPPLGTWRLRSSRPVLSSRP